MTEADIKKNRILVMINAFAFIPILISFFAVYYYIVSKQNYLNIIPIDILPKLSDFSILAATSAVIYIWFKLLMTQQTILLGLISLEIIYYDKSKQDKEMTKHSDHFKKYHGKFLSTNNLLLRHIYKIWSRSYAIKLSVSIFLLYMVIVYLGNSDCFRLY